MMKRSRWGTCLGLLALAFGQSACTTMSLVETGRDGAVPAAIEPGDRISVVDTRGELLELDVTAVGTDFIEGSASDGEPGRIATAEIAELRERRAAPGKVAALVGGLVFGLFMSAAADYGSVVW
jgi:hypothetical protein